jgi:hypothetical protein
MHLGGKAQGGKASKPAKKAAVAVVKRGAKRKQEAPRLRDSKGRTVVLSPEAIASAPCSTREQELLEDGGKLGTPQKGGPDSGVMTALTGEQRTRLEEHLAEEQEALQEKEMEGQGPGARGGSRARKRLKVGDARGALAEAPD